MKNNNRGELSLELALIIALLIMGAIFGLSYLGWGISTKFVAGTTFLNLGDTQVATLTVTDENGLPVENAEVVFNPLVTESNTKFTGTSNAEGEVLIEDVKVGTYEVEISRPGYITTVETVTVEVNSELDMDVVIENQAIINVKYYGLQYSLQYGGGKNYTPNIYGTVTPGGIVKADYGTDKTINFVPEAGKYLDSIFIDGVWQSDRPDNSFTFTNIVKSHSMDVYFTDVAPVLDGAITGAMYIDDESDPDTRGYRVDLEIRVQSQVAENPPKYTAQAYAGDNSYAEIVRVNLDGSHTVLASRVGGVPGANYTNYTLTATGNRLTLSCGGTTVLDVYDPNPIMKAGWKRVPFSRLY